VRPVPSPRPISGATVEIPLRRLRALPDARFLDTLLRSRAWIWMIGIGLGGIVFMQVSMLKLNAGISQDVQRSADLQRANADLEEQVAELSGGDRISAAAQHLGLIMPDAGQVVYVTPGAEDAARAAARIRPPSDQARQLLGSGGLLPGQVAPVSATPAPAAAVTPAATAVPAASATPVATATPAVTAAPVATQAPAGGAAAAP
jgi:cell division protein FtsB